MQKRQVNKILNQSFILKNYIHAGKIVEEINNPPIREIIEGNYRIVTKSKVHILMVHHGARDLTQRIPKE